MDEEIATPVETPAADASAPEPEADVPKRGRGRPAGARNKPKIQVIPMEPVEEAPEAAPVEPEPEAPDPTPKKRTRTTTPRPKAPSAPVVMKAPEPQLDHHTVMRYMASYIQEAAHNERQAKQDHYSRLIGLV
jgi:hypothetical protein